MTVRKFNYVRFGIFIAIVLAILIGIIIGIVSLVKHISYTKSYEYKLINVGYSKEDSDVITKKLKDSEIEELLTLKYDESYVTFINEKYFIYSNLDKYVEYKKNNKNYENSKIVAIINTEANIDWFDNEKETDISDNELMLVNRLYGLNKDYEVEDIVSIPTKYAYSGNKISESILDDIMDLADAAKESGYTFVVSGSYRSYKDQEKLYNSYVNSMGKSEADKIVARPGHSEYETGLSFGFVPYNKSYSNDKALLSEEYLWLKENAHNYGFIFRFEAEKEYLTGFSADTWRLRYVGVDAASVIYANNLTFEEYYAYYVKGKK